MSDLPNRFSIDPKPNKRKDGLTIEIPIQPGGVKTILTLVLGEDGRIHMAGPLNDLPVAKRLLEHGMRMVKNYEASRLVQPAQMLPPGMKPH